MPYYRCAECDLTVYSAAGHSRRRECPDCRADLHAAKPVFIDDARPSDGRRQVREQHDAGAGRSDLALLGPKLGRAELDARLKPLASGGASV